MFLASPSLDMSTHPLNASSIELMHTRAVEVSYGSDL